MALPIPSLGEKRGKHAVFTVEECTACKVKTKRPFKLGDFVFREAGECAKCKNRTIIAMIYSEPIKTT